MKRIRSRIAKTPLLLVTVLSAILIALSVVLYAMQQGPEPAVDFRDTIIEAQTTDGYRFYLVNIHENVCWDDVTLSLTDGTNSANWLNVTADELNDVTNDFKNFGSQTLGSLSVTLMITDVEGNGKLDKGDYIDLTAHSFVETTDYKLTIIYEPTDGIMAAETFPD